MKNRMRILLLAGWFGLVTSTTTPVLGNQEKSEKSRVEKLLLVYWDNDRSNRESASVLWSVINRGNASDEAELFAFIANQVEHNNHRRARTAARLLTTVAPNNARAWEIRIWLEAIMDDFDTAATTLRNIGPYLNPDSSLTDNQRLRIVGRLGRIAGYLEGPVRDRVADDVLQIATEDLLSHLTPDQRKRWEENRQKALQIYRELQKVNEAKIDAEKKRIEKQDEIEMANLEQQARSLDERISQLNPQLAAIRAEGARQVSLAEQEIIPLQSQLGQLNNQINREQLALGFLTNDLVFYQNNFPNSLNVALIRNSLRATQFNLSNLYNQANAIDNQLAFARSNVIRTRREFDRQTELTLRQIRDLERAKSRNVKRQGEIARGPRVASGKLDAYDERERSLKTYMQYPLEFLRQDLLTEYVK